MAWRCLFLGELVSPPPATLPVIWLMNPQISSDGDLIYPPILLGNTSFLSSMATAAISPPFLILLLFSASTSTSPTHVLAEMALLNQAFDLVF